MLERPSPQATTAGSHSLVSSWSNIGPGEARLPLVQVGAVVRVRDSLAGAEGVEHRIDGAAAGDDYLLPPGHDEALVDDASLNCIAPLGQLVALRRMEHDWSRAADAPAPQVEHRAPLADEEVAPASPERSQSAGTSGWSGVTESVEAANPSLGATVRPPRATTSTP